METPFSMNYFVEGAKNFMQDKLYTKFGQLSQSGILQGWENLEKILHQISFMDNYKPELMGRFLAKLISGGKKEIIFHEAEPVSLHIMKYIFALWALCVGVDGMVWMAEWVWYDCGESGRKQVYFFGMGFIKMVKKGWLWPYGYGIKLRCCMYKK